MDQGAEKTAKNHRKLKYGIIIILAALAVTAGIIAICFFSTIHSLKEDAAAVKETAGQLLAAVKEMDTDEIDLNCNRLEEESRIIRQRLQDPLLKTLPKLSNRSADIFNDLQMAEKALDILDGVNKDLFRPFSGLLAEHPVSEVKKGTDVDADTLQAYVDFFEKYRPGIRDFLDQACDLHFKYLDLKEEEKAIAEDALNAKELIVILGEAKENVFKPMISLMREHPLSELKKTEKGLNVGMLLAYLNMLDRMEPKIPRISEKLSGLQFHYVHIDFQKYLQKILFLFDDLDQLKDYRDLIRMFLGDGQDRLYLVMAQNLSEIRASGGFPGAMGVVRIKNGILSMGDFSSVRNFLKLTNTEEADITYNEQLLFQYMYARYSHDACYNPHFSKVAWITKVAYEQIHEEEVDGVIAVTPEIIQKILEFTGETIKLKDGTVLDSDNATKVLQRDLYYRYQGDSTTAIDNNYYIDNLFAETAKNAVGLLFRSISMETIGDYLEFLGACGENRMMLLWFDDAKAEEAAEKINCSGNLNSNPKRPTAGVYFSCCDPGKLGMFTAIVTTVSAPRAGTLANREYEVRVTFNNYISTEDVTDINSWYLLGSNNKAIQGYAYFFAPAGGTVSDFKVSNGMYVRTAEYEDLQVGYLINLFLYPGKPVSVTYKVTLAPGCTEPLRIDQTPTLQNYR